MKKFIFILIITLYFSISVFGSLQTDSSSTEFNQGTYNQTYHNSTLGYVRLNNSYNNGSYTSKIFNVGTNSEWHNITWASNAIGELPSNQQVETSFVTGNANMTGNLLLFHLNQDSSQGESTTLMKDFSGMSNNGTCTGATCPTWAPSGKIGGAYNFDGGDSITRSTLALGPTATFEVWAFADSLAPYPMLWNHPSSASTTYFDVIFYNNVISMNTGDGSNNPFKYANGSNIPVSAISLNVWHHYVIINDASLNQALFYLDGYYFGYAAYKNPTSTTGRTMGLGGVSPYLWDGMMDEFAVYNRSLTATEVLEHYERGVNKLNLTVRSCDDTICDAEPWVDVNDTSSQQLNLANNSYFQYKFNFEGSGNATPKLYNVSIDYDLIPSLDHYYVRTYNQNDLPRSNFANQSIVRIKTNITNEVTPSITITDSEGNIQVLNALMINESNLFVYNYTLNGSNGWYDVTINSQDWPETFYQAEKWLSDYTDANSNPFAFRRMINVTEPGINERFFEPIDVELNFSYQPVNTSVRVLEYNGSDFLEIPSQIYNLNQSNGNLYSANIVFLATLNKSELRNYYITTTKSATEKNYTTDLIYIHTSDKYTIGNSYFVSFFNTSTGGLMQDLYNSIGTNNTLAGATPIDYYPEFQIGLTTYNIRSDDSVSISNIEGNMFYLFNVSAEANDDITKPYYSNCKIYSKSQYMICEKNQSTTATQNWKNFFITGLIFDNTKLTDYAYKNSTNNIQNGTLSSISNIDSNTKWIAFYDDLLGNAIAELFLNNSFSVTNNPSFSIEDETDYGYYRRQLIGSTSTSVPANSMFYTRTARLIYNGLQEYNFVDEIYQNLNNPLAITLNSEETSDALSPYYTITGNFSTNDTSNATVYSYWFDDSFLDYATINVTGPGSQGENTLVYSNSSYSIRSGSELINESWLNITINSSSLESGTHQANITVYDISGKSNSTIITFVLTDTTSPSIINTTLSPNTASLLDPNVTVTISSTITEYSTLDKILLYYRFSSSDWSSTEMTNSAQTNYNYTYEGNFTPESEGVYEYYIYANDTQGNYASSTTQTINVTYDYTWNIISDLTTAADVFNTNVSLGNIILNNTGDFPLTFTASAGVLGSRVYLNNTLANTQPTFTLENNTIFTIIVNATTRQSGLTEGTDTITITFTNASANPTSSSTSVDLITITGGPYLYTTLTCPNTTAYAGDSGIEITARVENLGNETATNVNVTLELPTYLNSQYNLVSQLGTINIGSYETYTIMADVSSTATAGAITTTANSVCSENKTGTASLILTILETQTEESTPDTNTGDNGGSSGGGSSGGGSTLSQEEAERFFKSTEVFELKRGEDQIFKIALSNPYTDASLRNMYISLKGFTEDYIDFYPDYIDSLSKGAEENITVEITAPGYFTQGQYDLEFSITGEVVKNESTIIPLRYTKEITLYVFEVSRAEALEFISLSNSYLNEMKSNGWYTKDIEDLLNKINISYNETDFLNVKNSYEELYNLYSSAKESSQGIFELEEDIKQAELKEISVQESKRLVYLAQSAFTRGQFIESKERLKEARLSFAIETKGKFLEEIAYSMKSNPGKTGTGAATLLALIFSGSIFTRWNFLKRKLKKLEEEEKLLFELMRAVQKDVFEKAKMSMKEYGEAMVQYEARLNQVFEERINAQNKKHNLLKLKSKKKKLLEEKERLIKMMKKAQKDYITGNKYETRIYENMLKSYSKRLADIEEQIAVSDVKKAIRKI